MLVNQVSGFRSSGNGMEMAKSAQLTGRQTKSRISEAGSSSFRDFGDQTSKAEVKARSVRLREAIQLAESVKGVAERAAIALSTLNSYLAGGEMKASALVALADACEVSIEWLATGRGAMRPGDQAESPPRTPELYTTLDIPVMADALEAAVLRFARRGRPIPWRGVAQLAALIYNQLLEMEAKEKATIDQPTVNPNAENEP